MASRADVEAAPARRLSAALSGLCLVLIVAGPAASLLIFALRPDIATEGLGLTASSGAGSAVQFTTIERIAIVLVNLVPVAFVTYALVCARRCFRRFIEGEYFTSRVVASLRGLAAGLALWVLATWLTTPLLSILLTLGAEEHRLTVEISQSGLLTLLFAGIIWQIADIMTRAAAIAEENSQFV